MAKICEKVHALIRDVDREVVARAPCELSHQPVALIAILQPRPANMRREIALPHEFGDHRLVEAGRLAVYQVAGADECSEQ